MEPQRALLGRGLVACALLVHAACVGAQVRADDFPRKAVRLVVPSAPGGGTDIVARVLAQKVAQGWGQTVVVDNVSGGATTIGTNTVARAAPDGHTLLMTAVNFVFLPLVQPKLPYDIAADFEPVLLVCSLASAIVVHPSMPVRSVRDLVALARARPGEIRYGSGGSGTVIHFSTELLRLAAGIQLLHVPYKGAGPATTSVLGGETQMLVTTLAAVQPHVVSGRLRALATTGAARAKSAPELPTAAEAGLPGYVFENWYGLWAPARTPRGVVTTINVAFDRALSAPDVNERFTAPGIEPIGGSPERFAAKLQAETKRWASVAREAGIRAD